MVGNETNKDRSEETMAEGLQPTTTTWPNASNETNVTTDLPDASMMVFFILFYIFIYMHIIYLTNQSNPETANCIQYKSRKNKEL